MRITNEDVFTDDEPGPIDMTADWQSRPLWLGNIINCSIQLVYTGTPNGTLKLQGSNDEGNGRPDRDKVITGVENWTDIENSDKNITAAGNGIWNVQDIGFRWIRVVWTDAASVGGSEITSARFNAKGL